MKIGFIGAGNIASAIILGITKDNFINKEDILVYDILKCVSEKYENDGFVACKNIEEIFVSDIIFLTVKPQFYIDTLSKMGDIKNKVIVTVAPGITIQKVAACLDSSCSVIRTMPNTPLAVGEGMTVMARDKKVTDENFLFVKEMFEKSGKVAVLSEKLIDATVGISGSSPAYVFMFIEALADSGVFNGLDRETSYLLASQAVLGSAKMLLETGKHPGELKDMVCSPGGTTIRAVKALEDNNFKSAIMSACNECYKKAKELG